MMDIDIIFQKKKVLVAGLGVTGIPVIKRLLALGNHITAFDNNTSLDPGKVYSAVGSPPREDIEIILGDSGALDKVILENIGLIVTSPGIPSTNKVFALAAERGIPVWDELELSWRLLGDAQRSNIIAVTGTNGKTTVVNLIGEILQDSGIENKVCGNVGSPLLDTFKIDTGTGRAEDDNIVRVVEVSSFQLERSYSFRPGVGILLNITSDHMDRHGSIEEYSRIKMTLFSHQGSNDTAIMNTDDRISSLLTEKIAGIKEGPLLVRYGIERKNSPAVWYGGGDEVIHYDLPSGSGKVNIKGALLKGMHNMSNSAAAAAAALIIGADPDSIGRSIRNFRPLSHRMEYLGEIAGIRCINDSKSTNPDSIIAALRDFSKEVTLIMGGLDKDMDFTPVLPSLDACVNNIILIGQSAAKMEELFSTSVSYADIYRCSSLEDAVKKGFEVTNKGGVLLLSPGCASMDMFRDYRHRGDSFKKAVMDLNNGN